MVSELEDLQPGLMPWAVRLLSQARAPYEITSVRRTPAQQARLYRLSQADPDYPYPVAPPECDCATHLQGWSWDMVSTLAELRRLGMLWRSWGGVWGDDDDPIHFQGTPAMARIGARMPQDQRSGRGPMSVGRNDRSFIRPL